MSLLAVLIAAAIALKSGSPEPQLPIGNPKPSESPKADKTTISEYETKLNTIIKDKASEKLWLESSPEAAVKFLREVKFIQLILEPDPFGPAVKPNPTPTPVPVTPVGPKPKKDEFINAVVRLHKTIADINKKNGDAVLTEDAQAELERLIGSLKAAKEKTPSNK